MVWQIAGDGILEVFWEIPERVIVALASILAICLELIACGEWCIP